jgi:hypothetical protein
LSIARFALAEGTVLLNIRLLAGSIASAKWAKPTGLFET